MATIFNQPDCLSAWQSVSNQIINNGPQQNVIVEIDQPCTFANLQLLINRRNPKVINPQSEHIRHVINTIFPYGLSQLCANRQALYAKYEAIYLKGRNRHWGTYFQRLISFNKHFNNAGINQLENAINALNGGSPQRNYIVFHLTSGTLDSNVRPMGAPCWHFGQITVNDDSSINLVAVYRAQDYFSKALGNFIGLAKLLEFICQNTNRRPGRLIIHAVYAYNGSTRANLTALTI